MKPSQLTKRIEELSEKLKPIPSEGIRIDFSSFTEPEQLVLLKNYELEEKYRNKWTQEAVLENKDLILKCNHIIISREVELFLFVMPKALMLDEVEERFFKFCFTSFLKQWIECQKRLRKWSTKDREDFLRGMKGKPRAHKKHESEVEFDGENNN